MKRPNRIDSYQNTHHTKSRHERDSQLVAVNFYDFFTKFLHGSKPYRHAGQL